MPKTDLAAAGGPMDFTYLVAFVLAALVGIICQLILQLARLDERFGVGTVFGVALIANVAVLFNWRAIGGGLSSFDAQTLLADIIVLPMSTFVGVLAGVVPFIVAAGICRKVFALGRKKAGS